ncbi:Beta-barrel assembly machine subunit BamC [Modicisalibacter muralis]|uniref:Beta-barrel assembly machine subunit BamC n=1 Tax=Modicisalibacter muralis TaxID=119000 RepID=A0A1G9JWX3_9GAMM|nr:outer membrane protein assembly factor BamC [Halomonas muralis]SDL41981.1 Beta-barrel assembly machine subunit BamC [Halomonas muralis]
MRPLFKWMPLAVSMALVISGCGGDGYYYNRNEEYRSAEMTAPLDLPETRAERRYQNAMPVPDAHSDFLASGEFEVPRPQSLAVSSQSDQRFVELREAGDDRWLLVSSAPASVWPQLQGFVEDHGLEVTALDASRGRIATTQAVLRVRQGLRGNTSEVRCEGPAAANGQCLRALQGYLGAVDEDERSVSLAAQDLSRVDRVRLENQQGEWQLWLALDFERAWSELLYQLDNSFDDEGQLLDQNRSAGEFLVEYTPNGGDGGSFFGLFGSDAEPRQYRLMVNDAGQNATRVTVASAGDTPLADGEARELLDTLAATLR